MLPVIHGEFGVVADPDIKFSEKGGAWMSLRVVAKDRVRDQNGTWQDGDPLFLNVLVFGKQAEHLCDSVGKGDTIVVVGRLKPNEWTDREGAVHKDVQITADEVAVSVRWNPAQTPRYKDSAGTPAGTPAAADDEPPF